jgi:hypothetical protein
MTHLVTGHRFRPFTHRGKHNYVKIVAFTTMAIWQESFHQGMTLKELAAVLKGVSTYASLRVLAGRWLDWGYLRRERQGACVMYSITAHGLEYRGRHFVEMFGVFEKRYIALENLKNRIIAYRESKDKE